jgi:nitrogen fixation NifU-like protein
MLSFCSKALPWHSTILNKIHNSRLIDMKLYQEELMEHYRASSHRGELENPSFSASDDNPSCGDRISMQGIVENNILISIKFTGSGCILSQASASIIAEYFEKKSLHEILQCDKKVIIEHIGFPLGPNRVKCALLPLFVLQEGIRSYVK